MSANDDMFLNASDLTMLPRTGNGMESVSAPAEAPGRPSAPARIGNTANVLRPMGTVKTATESVEPQWETVTSTALSRQPCTAPATAT
ncbi:hypothetical protein CTRI78_v005727 [Colletotrichum trifolii]|uniref:Uncharacterized protein n=1 Tax=Colletotrichum trifolii TaxID=5466 RepID=A0A4R8RKY4_COLTR|nr:hypothetical protein CTRI78_v005727 [Colletotrichum trifolii]